jgi:hypothetical protein
LCFHHVHKRLLAGREPCAVFDAEELSGWVGRVLALSTLMITVVVLVGGIDAPDASAVLAPPATVAGPDASIVDFGGIAMAPDGTGGLVFLKSVGGVPHVFAAQYDGSNWGPPIRVDQDQPYEASQPRIAAGSHGELMVVWVTETATVKRRIRWGIFSARLGRGAGQFGPSLLVDPNVGEGQGVDPSLAGVAPGKAIVAYRAVTYNFSPENQTTENSRFVELRPGDVMAEVRLARFGGERWSRLGAINRNLASSVRSPSVLNAPQVGVGNDGGAVVAWQEPDQTGTARIWLRRVFGTTLGPILEASPETWSGSPLGADIDAFSLAVTPFDAAYLAMRTAPEAGTSRLFLNYLPNPTTSAGKALVGTEQVAEGPFGAPNLAASEEGGGKAERAVQLATVAGGQPDVFGAEAGVKLTATAVSGAPAAEAGSEAVAAVDYEGDGILAYPTVTALGSQLAVRQSFASGDVQTSLVSGSEEGPIGELSIGRSGGGDALIGFRQGEPGHFEIVAERASVPPARFPVEAPEGWVPPTRAILKWQPAASATGGMNYSVLLDGRPVACEPTSFRCLPSPVELGDGVIQAQVLATDGLGQRLLSKPVKLKVDALPPRITVRAQFAHDKVEIKIEDRDSGVRAAATRVSFGDGRKAMHGIGFAHKYAHGGTYSILVKARDRVGNTIARRFEVKVR